jgi:hypothetical protein
MGGLNQYCPNPVGWVDPLGLICKEHVETKSMEKLQKRGYAGVRVTKNGGLDYSDSNALYLDPDRLKPNGEVVQPIVEIRYTGDYQKDFEVASLAGFGQKSTPNGYVWHHLDDYDPATNTGTMQLVQKRAHNGIAHNGGVSQYKTATGNSYIFKSW